MGFRDDVDRVRRGIHAMHQETCEEGGQNFDPSAAMLEALEALGQLEAALPECDCACPVHGRPAPCRECQLGRHIQYGPAHALYCPMYRRRDGESK